MILRKLTLGVVHTAPVAAVAMAVLLPLFRCGNVVKPGLSFELHRPISRSWSTARQFYRFVVIDGQPIDSTFPRHRGLGLITYSLTPEVPGLMFDPSTRTWRSTPAGVRTTARTHDVTYVTTDADGDSVFRGGMRMLRNTVVIRHE